MNSWDSHFHFGDFGPPLNRRNSTSSASSALDALSLAQEQPQMNFAELPSYPVYDSMQGFAFNNHMSYNTFTFEATQRELFAPLQPESYSFPPKTAPPRDPIDVAPPAKRSRQSTKVATKPAPRVATPTSNSGSNIAKAPIVASENVLPASTSGSYITLSYWDAEKTVVLFAVMNGLTVPRRLDNDNVNVTKILNLTSVSRGTRDGVLRSFQPEEKTVAKKSPVALKGVWVSLERAKGLATTYELETALFPLFESQDHLNAHLLAPERSHKTAELVAAIASKWKESGSEGESMREWLEKMQESLSSPVVSMAPNSLPPAPVEEESSTPSTSGPPPLEEALSSPLAAGPSFVGDFPRITHLPRIPNTFKTCCTRRWSHAGVDSTKLVPDKRAWGSVDAGNGSGELENTVWHDATIEYYDPIDPFVYIPPPPKTFEILESPTNCAVSHSSLRRASLPVLAIPPAAMDRRISLPAQGPQN